MRRSVSASVLVAMVGLTLLVTAAPAMAACHVAAFVEPEVEGQESVGTVALIVELRGRQGSCAGTVDFATQDGTAVAGEDYEAATGTLTFEENDDRVETIDLVLLEDADAEEVEQFAVALTNPTGSISGTGDPATIVIADAASGDAPVDDEPVVDEPVDDGPIDDEAVEDAPVVEDEPVIAEEPLERGGNGLLIAVIAMAVVGLAAFVGLRGRG